MQSAFRYVTYSQLNGSRIIQVRFNVGYLMLADIHKKGGFLKKLNPFNMVWNLELKPKKNKGQTKTNLFATQKSIFRILNSSEKKPTKQRIIYDTLIDPCMHVLMSIHQNGFQCHSKASIRITMSYYYVRNWNVKFVSDE